MMRIASRMRTATPPITAPAMRPAEGFEFFEVEAAACEDAGCDDVGLVVEDNVDGVRVLLDAFEVADVV
jgi:hypothetical protein